MLLVPLALLASVVVLKRLEVTSSSYETYDEIASNPRTFEAGWIPRWLPRSATNISESHDLDTNDVWIVFSFAAEDRFHEDCQEIEKTELRLPNESDVRRFPNFVIDAVSEIRSGSIIFYRCGDDTSHLLAVDHTNVRAYIWGDPNAN